MASYTTTGNTFVNPYNFVSLEKQCYKTINYENRKKQGNLTGWIECSLETLTPIFIPNTSSVQENEEGKKYSHVFDEPKTEDGQPINSYDFYSYTNLEGVKNPQAAKPVIPGSEIRGMIRSAFEAVTNSCLSTIDDEQKLYKRVTSPAMPPVHPGPGRLILEDAEWKIIKCNKYKLLNNISRENGKIMIDGQWYTEGDSVNVKTYKNSKAEISKKGTKQGFLHIGGEYEGKKYESVFIPTGEDISIDRATVQNLIDNFKLYQDETVNLHLKKKEHTGYRHISKNAEKLKWENMHEALIYCAEHDGKYYLSPAAIGREVFYTKLNEIIGSFKPCDNLNELCQACALFGLAGKKKAAASRVRFTDALVLPEKYEYYETKTLKELASPKLSATEFYLERPEQGPDLWNYDYAGNWKNRKWYDIRNYKPEIRGRKFYWHQKSPDPFLENGDSPSERNVHVRPLKKGAMFTFRVYFNDISKDELNKLLWVLEIGGRKENAHKIGRGKPIGMGSVKIHADSVKRRKIQINETVKHEMREFEKPSYGDIENALVNPNILDEFLKIMDFQNAPENVKYPSNEGENKVYEWFVANKQIGRGTGTAPVIHQTLPEIGKPSLKSYIDTSKKKTILVHRFAPLFLTVRNIGPFFEKPAVFDFTDANDDPCNFYLLIAGNGMGKTTVLELMVFLMEMLEYENMESFGNEGMDENHGSVQWDILIKFKEKFSEESQAEYLKKPERAVVLSLLAGSSDKSVILEWDSDRLKNVGATSWHQFGFWRNESGRLVRLGKNDSFVNDFLNEIRTNSDAQPNGFENPAQTLPTLLYFSAYRDIPPINDKMTMASPENWKPVDWGYKCIRQIVQEGNEWRKSLDNLFMWLEHTDTDFFENAKNTVNVSVFKRKDKYFKGMQKNPPEAIIHNRGREHSFDKLSSGEKSLLQLFSCLSVYMTPNTILLIDEMDVHLHSKWQHRVLNLLKKLVKDHPGLTVIATTHSREILSAFAYEIKEDKLRKGGYIIEDEL